ncbi:MAG: NAD(P)/FAD-dependent oxidoreductase [Alphaproteobacteria bacterium]
MTDGNVDVLIVGAGAYGLSCAWWMARRRSGARILVVDEGEFASGASGRNGAGFRMQWGLELNIRLCQEGIAFFERAAEELDYPRGFDLKQDGYLVLAHSAKAFATLKSVLPKQHELGVPSEILDADECIKMVPPLGRDRLVGGAFCNKDGSASPFLWLDALLKACRREGVEVRYGTRVSRIDKAGGGFRAQLGGDSVEAKKVLLCTDWAVPELLAPLGLELPVVSLPKEGIVTTPCKPMVKPILVSLEHHISVNQVGRGSIIFIVARQREGSDIASTPDFLAYASPKIMDLLPGLAAVPVLRTWGGVSSVTPDMQPILGETELEGIYVAVSSYRGFMTSPTVGRMMAALVLDGDTNDPLLSQLSPRRFRTGDLIVEPLLNQE